MNRELWPHQRQGLEALRQSISQGIRRIVLCAPTGSGKTLLSTAIIEGARKKGNKVAFVLSSLSLVDQTVEAFYADGIRDISVIQGGHRMTDWSRGVQICSIQTLASRGAFPTAQVVIIDECHVLHQAHKKWLTDPDWQDVPFIGLSATPGTRGLGKYFQTLLTVSTTSELIEAGYLSPFKVFGVGHPDLSGVKITAGDYQENQLSEAMQQGTLTADIVKTWKERWGKDKTLCYAVDCAHAKSIQERFEQAGIACGYQDARTLDDERRDIKRKFHSGEYPVVVNVATLTTGTDWNCHCLILARPTKSSMLFQQIIGRCLRTSPDKEIAIILDHSDTTARLGFVTEIHWDSLDDGKPKDKSVVEKKVALPKVCESCSFLKPPKTKKCPNCGHETTIRSEIVEADGELIEFTPGMMRTKAPSRPKVSEGERRAFYADLRGYAAEHGYNSGWAFHKYVEKYQEKPPRGFDDVPPSAEVSPIVASWIKSRAIAWAKSKKRQEMDANA
jgi:DNA repair protein RadD